jgi:hypothetical protein
MDSSFLPTAVAALALRNSNLNTRTPDPQAVSSRTSSRSNYLWMKDLPVEVELICI